MKEFATRIAATHFANQFTIGRDLQLATIKDNGRWFKNSKDHQIPEHNIDLIFSNGENITQAKNFISEAFRSGRETLTHYEIQKTEKERLIIGQIGWSVNLFVNYFDGAPPNKQDLNRYHILKPGGVEKIYKGKTKEATYDPRGHCVSIDRSPSDIVFAVRAGHETFHLVSPAILQVTDGVVMPYRMGLIANEDGETKRLITDEAINSQTNLLQFNKTIKGNPLFKEELTNVQKIKPWITEILDRKGYNEKAREVFLDNIYTIIGAKEILKILEGNKSQKYKLDYLTDVINYPQENRRLYTIERNSEWKYFTNLANELIQKSKELNDPDKAIRSRNEVFDMFARVKFAPNHEFPQKLWNLKSTVDEILGEGSFDELM